MANVFLSYDHEDLDRAKPIALALENAGHSVWWDLHIKGGEQYSNVIDKALRLADAVVVLWSARSIESPWVRDEAAAGRDRGALVPVLIDPVQPPLGFRQYQNIDMTARKGRASQPRFGDLCASIEGLSGTVAPAPQSISPIPKSRRPKPRLAIVAGIAALVLLAAGALFMFHSQAGSAMQTVSVAATDPGAEPLARDLMVKLATLQSAKSGSMRLLDDGEQKARRADLVFEIGGEINSAKPHSSLVLLAGKDRSILWSGDFAETPGGPADLKEQTAFTAARVLGCTLEGLAPDRGALRPNVLKLYLNACALLDESFFHDTGPAVSILQQVTKAAPEFVPGWSKLLVAETNHFQSLSAEGHRETAGHLRQVIADARKIDPNIPEAYIAEIELLPGGTFTEQVRLIDLALKAGPENAFVLAGRSLVMLCVGRMDAAVEDAQNAARLDPLSPAIRSSYIQALIYSGRTDAARTEIKKAEDLWPGAATILDARYRLELRYGNAAEAANAQRMMQAGSVEAGRMREALVRARLDPSSQNVDNAVEVATSAFRAKSEIDTTGDLILTLAEFDRTEQLVQLLLNWKDASQIPYFSELLFRPPAADLHADPRFIRIAAHLGLLDYWQRSGDWPDFCADPDLPYDCKKEAAKLKA